MGLFDRWKGLFGLGRSAGGGARGGGGPGPSSGGGKGGGGRHHGHHHHHHHHGGGWRGRYVYPRYDAYDAPVIVEQIVPELIIVDAQTGAILTIGATSPRANNMWIRVDEAVRQNGSMIVRLMGGGIGVNNHAYAMKLPIIDRPPAFPNQQVVFVP
jgi:hypothetical protein